MAVESAFAPGDSIEERCLQCPVLNHPTQFLQTHTYGFAYAANAPGVPLFLLSSVLPSFIVFAKESCLFMICPK